MGVKPNRGPKAGRYIAAVRASRPLFLYAVTTLAVSTVGSAQEPPDAWLGPDKPVHALAGAWAGAAAYAGGIELDLAPADRRRAAVAAGLGSGLAKEAFDRWIQGERFSFKDLAAGAAGLAVFIVFSAAADR